MRSFIASRIGSLAGKLWPWAFLALILVLFGVIEVRSVHRTFGEPDPTGYLLAARAIASGHSVAFPEDDPFRFQDHIWVQNDQGEVVCKFDPGYPLILAVSRLFFGEASVFWVNAVLGGLALIGAFLLFRLWMSELAALLAVATFGGSLLFTFYTLWPLTHIADVCCVTWGMWFLWMWSRSPTAFYALGSGVLLGFAVMIRHANILLVLPIGAAVLAHVWAAWRDKIRPSRSVLFMAAAYAIPLVILAVYQWRYFGSPLTSGYTLAGEQHSFALKYWDNRMPRYLAALRDYVGLPFLVGVFALGLVGSARDRWMRLLWVIPPLLIHGCYYWEQHWFQWNLRLILPTLLVYFGAAFALLDRDRMRGFKPIILIAFCAMALRLDRGISSPIGPVPSLWHSDTVSLQRETGERLRSLLATLSDDAVVFADPPACYYLAARRHLVVYDLRAFNLVESQQRWSKPSVNPDEEPRMQSVRMTRFRELYAHHSQVDLTQMKRFRIDERLQRGFRVFYLVLSDHLKQEQDDLGPAFGWKRFDVQTPMQDQALYEITPLGSVPISTEDSSIKALDGVGTLE